MAAVVECTYRCYRHCRVRKVARAAAAVAAAALPQRQSLRTVRARVCLALDGDKFLWETQNGRCQRVFLHRQRRHVHQLLRRGDRGRSARVRAHHENANTEYPFSSARTCYRCCVTRAPCPVSGARVTDVGHYGDRE